MWDFVQQVQIPREGRLQGLHQYRQTFLGGVFGKNLLRG